MKKQKYFIITMIASILSCTTMPKTAIHASGRTEIMQLRSIMQELSLDSNITESEFFAKHLAYYGLQNLPKNHIKFGFLTENNVSLSAIRFTPENPKASILLIHGYLEHSLINRYLILDLYERNYDVLCIDLPGHGFSSGPSAAVDDFSEYSDAIEIAKKYIKQSMKEPYYAIAHSTGCSSLLENYYTYTSESFFAKTVFIAPLVHCSEWFWTTLGNTLIVPTGYDPPLGKTIFGSKEYIEMSNSDPLRSYFLDHRWVRALVNWNEKNQFYKTCSEKLLVIQGHNDTVVDYKYNLPYLQQRFTNLKIVEVKEFSHWVTNEVIENRNKLFTIISSYLEDCM